MFAQRRIHSHAREGTRCKKNVHAAHLYAQVEAVIEVLSNKVTMNNHDTLEMAFSAVSNLASNKKLLSQIIALGAHKVTV